MIPTSNLTGLLLALASSFVTLLGWLLVLIVAFVRWSHTRQYLRQGVILATITFLAGLPLLVLTVAYMDLSKSMPPALAPNFGRMGTIVAALGAVAVALVGLAHSCLELPVSLLIDPDRCPFPLLLGKERRFGGWAVGAAWGVLAGAISLAAFQHLRVEVNPLVNTLHALTPGLNRVTWAYQLGVFLPAVVGAALAEEVVYRGLIQPWLARAMGGTRLTLVLSIVATSALWAIAHALNTSNVSAKLLQIFAIGLIFGVIARRYSVEASMVAHALLNVVGVITPLLLVTMGIVHPDPSSRATEVEDEVEAVEERPHPLPLGAGSPTIVLDESPRVEWARRNLLDAYDRVGSKSPRWDKEVRHFIEDATPDLIDVHHSERVWAKDLLVRGREILSKGCNDPLFLYLQARSLAIGNGYSRESRLLHERAVEGMKTVPYPRAVARLAASNLYADYQSAKDIAGRRVRLTPLELQWFTESLEDGSYRAGEEAVLVWQLMNETSESFFERNKLAAAAAVARSAWIEQWAKLLVSGLEHRDMAWDARGDKFAKDVTPDGRKNFKMYLQLARRDLVEAWRLRPDRPEAAFEMMGVAEDAPATGESLRMWFDRAVAARFDYWPAYEARINRLRPRWGGSYEEMLAFGEECLDTGRFDTYVPSVLLHAVRRIEDDQRDNLGEGQGTLTIHSDPRTFRLVSRTLDGYLGEATRTWERPRWLSLYAVFADKAGERAIALEKMRSAGMELDADAVWRIRERARLFVSRVSALGGAGQAEASRAEGLRDALDPARALDALAEAMRKDPSPESAFYFKHRVASLSLEKGLEGEAWIPFMPSDGDLSGWNVREGKWTVGSDAALEAPAGPRWTILSSDARVEPDFEMRGLVDFQCTTSEPNQAAIVLGNYRDWTNISLLKNYGRSVTSPKGASPIRVPAADHNAFLLRSWHAVFTGEVNGQPIAGNHGPAKGLPDERDPHVGFGAYYEDPACVVRYRNVEIRKLTAPPSQDR